MTQSKLIRDVCLRPILIVTSRRDSHADAAIAEFDRRGVEVYRLNSEDLCSSRIMFALGDFSNFSARICNEAGRLLDISSGAVGWLRKPRLHRADGLPPHANFINSEFNSFIDALYALRNITWLNEPFTANRSRSKIQQLVTAARLGVRVPRTVITTDPNTATAFARTCVAGVALKALYTANVTVNGLNQAIPTRRLSALQVEASCESVKLAPTQLQEYIEKKFELRVTVIGDKVFAVGLKSQESPNAQTDWRLGVRDIEHFRYDLPIRIRDFCIDLLKDQGLAFGAIDLIVTPRNEYVFLENNPYGQYLWLEHMLDLPLTSTICDYLVDLAGAKPPLQSAELPTGIC